MAEETKDAAKVLVTCKARLIDILMGDPDFVLQRAHPSMSDRHYHTVKALTNPSEKVRDLLDYVINKGSPAAMEFLKLLRQKCMQETFPKLSFLKNLVLKNLHGIDQNKTKRTQASLALNNKNSALTLLKKQNLKAVQNNHEAKEPKQCVPSTQKGKTKQNDTIRMAPKQRVPSAQKGKTKQNKDTKKGAKSPATQRGKAKLDKTKRKRAKVPKEGVLSKRKCKKSSTMVDVYSWLKEQGMEKKHKSQFKKKLKIKKSWKNKSLKQILSKMKKKYGEEKTRATVCSVWKEMKKQMKGSTMVAVYAWLEEQGMEKKHKSQFKKKLKIKKSWKNKSLKQILSKMKKKYGEEKTRATVCSVWKEMKKQMKVEDRAGTTSTDTSGTFPNSMLAQEGNLSFGPPGQREIFNIIAQEGSTIVAPIISKCQFASDMNMNSNVTPSFAALLPKTDCKVEMEKGHFHVIRDEMKSNMKKTSERILEGIGTTQSVLLNKVYTELHIVDRDLTGVNAEHEVWQVAVAHLLNTDEGSVIKCNNIFQHFPGREIKCVLTKGIAGIGKTVTVQKFVLDWAEGRANQYIDLVFVLPFRKLNLIKDEHHSLLELLRLFHPELKKTNDIKIFDLKALFILDGLDESQLPLDFGRNAIVSDVTHSAPVDVLLTSLIEGRLLPSACLWITTRPAAAGQIPSEIFNQGYVTQIRGFNDQQKEEYFRKKFSDQNEASRIIAHLKTSRSLYIMCHVPLFCWLSANVLRDVMREGHDCREMPKSLTEMYIHFLITQTGFSSKKYHGTKEQDCQKVLEAHKDSILKLGKLAFRHLERQNVLFDEQDLRDCGIDPSEASLCPGVCAELFKVEYGLYQKKMYCFLHLSVQEFFAALYAFLEFADNNLDSLKFIDPKKAKAGSLSDFLKGAVDQALGSKNGHLDLFTRFLFGISLDSSKRLLRGLLPWQGSSSNCHKKVIQYITVLKRKDLSPERCMNLVHCLVELKDTSFLKEIEKNHNSLSKKPLTPFQCSVLAYQFLMSEEVLDVFDLKKYKTNEDCFQRLAPAIQSSKKALLSHSGITKKSCGTVALILQSPNSQLTMLDLSHNSFGDSGVIQLSHGLSHPGCKIKMLNLSLNSLGYRGMMALRDVMSSQNTHLRTLDLSNNDVEDSAVEMLSDGLRNGHLHELRLSGCRVTEVGCASLESALRSNPSHLRELDLSYNHPGDSGERLFALQEDPNYALEILKMDHGGECRNKPGLHKYAVDLTLDPCTTNGWLNLSEGNKIVRRGREQQSYPDHQERFDRCNQVLCKEQLFMRCYWEFEWSGREVHVGMAYKSISRKGASDRERLGHNRVSWSLCVSGGKCSAWHNLTNEPLFATPSSKIGVYLDWSAGTLSFYSISVEVTHLHTFHTTFTEPLYPAFRIQEPGATIILS